MIICQLKIRGNKKRNPAEPARQEALTDSVLCEERAGVRVRAAFTISSNSKREHGIWVKARADTNGKEMCCFPSANTF